MTQNPPLLGDLLLPMDLQFVSPEMRIVCQSPSQKDLIFFQWLLGVVLIWVECPSI